MAVKIRRDENGLFSATIRPPAGLGLAPVHLKAKTIDDLLDGVDEVEKKVTAAKRAHRALKDADPMA